MNQNSLLPTKQLSRASLPPRSTANDARILCDSLPARCENQGDAGRAQRIRRPQKASSGEAVWTNIKGGGGARAGAPTTRGARGAARVVKESGLVRFQLHFRRSKVRFQHRCRLVLVRRPPPASVWRPHCVLTTLPSCSAGAQTRHTQDKEANYQAILPLQSNSSSGSARRPVGRRRMLVRAAAQVGRVDQLLSRYGYCSRREARDWLRAGRVRRACRIIARGVETPRPLLPSPPPRTIAFLLQ